MNITIFAFGHAGSQITDKLVKLSDKRESIIEKVRVYDTAAKTLSTLSHVDENDTQLFGRGEFDGKGTEAVLSDVIPVAKETSALFKKEASMIKSRNTDAVLVIGSLGGGTSAATAPIAAQSINKHTTNIPVYGVGVLPGEGETKLYTLNSAKSIQSLNKQTNTLFLFDNKHLGVAMPDTTNVKTVNKTFDDVNNKIARCIYLAFSADEPQRATDRLNGSFIETNEIISTLNTGGLATMSYVSDSIPYAAMSGPLGYISESMKSMQITTQEKLKELRYKSQQFIASDTDTDNTETEENQSTSDTETTLQRDTESQKQDYKQDWTHPTDLIPYSLDVGNTMMHMDTKQGKTRICLLIGPRARLNTETTIKTTDWMEKHTHADGVICKNYPLRKNKVAVLSVISGIGIPKRIEEQQEEAKNIRSRVIASENTSNDDTKGVDIFNGEDTVTPTI